MIRYRNGAYIVTVYVGHDPITGRERRISRSVKMPEQRRIPTEVRELEGRLIAEVRGGQHGSPKLTVGELLDRWVEHVRRDRSTTTMHGYEQKIRLYLKPTLGGVRLEKLTTAQIDRLYRQLRDRGLSAATIRQAHAILRRALVQAQRWQWIHDNPAVFADPPRIHRDPIDPPNAEQLARLLDTDDDDLGDLIALAIATGMRRGELCGLRWSDLDLDAQEATIARTVVEMAHRTEVKSTKTGKPRRVALGANVTRRLRTRRARLVERALKGGQKLTSAAYVLSDDPTGQTPLHPNYASDRFRRHARRLGIPCRLHDLRHAAVTRALAAGIPVKDVSAHVGHESSKMTMDVYAHASPISHAVANAIDVAG